MCVMKLLKRALQVGRLNTEHRAETVAMSKQRG